MTPVVDGNLVNVDLIVTIFGVKIGVKGTIEVLAVRKRLE